MNTSCRSLSLGLTLLLSSAATPALAQAPVVATPAPAAPAPAPKPQPYSVPWQLRPTGVGNVVRSDTTLAFSELPDGTGAFTTASMLFGSYKVLPNLAPFVRLGGVRRAAGDQAGASFVNPALGATWSLQLDPSLRLGLFLGLTVPVGMGGGNTPDADEAAATRSGVLARSAMDNAMFAVDYFTVFPGVGLSYQRAGFTLQAEATLLQLTRVRGEAVSADPSRTNFTSGVHVGYFLFDQLSIGGEVRYQTWLRNNSVTQQDLRDNLTAAVGPRAHVKVGDVWLRPGLAYATAFDAPMRTQRYHIVQLDLPVSF